MAVISFARGVPAPECIPVELLADCARVALERGGEALLSYGPGGGYVPLREHLAARHGVDPARVIVTNGSLQGFVLLAEQLVSRGSRVLVEAPTYDRPLKILARLGAEVQPVATDDDGLDPDALADALRDGKKPAFLYTIPTFQNPSGRTLTAERRARVVELARDHDVLVIEDDPYGLVRFDGDPEPSLFELDGGERVVYASSFSKTMAPGLRIGWFVLPEELARATEELANGTYISPPFVTAATALEFLRRGAFEPNLERVRGLLRERRDAMLDALERELGGDARWSRPAGGYFVWVDLPGDVDTRELLPAATEAGVPYVAGRDFFPGGADGGSSLRLAYSFVSPAEIADGVARLAPLLRRAAAPAATL